MLNTGIIKKMSNTGIIKTTINPMEAVHGGKEKETCLQVDDVCLQSSSTCSDCRQTSIGHIWSTCALVNVDTNHSKNSLKSIGS